MLSLGEMGALLVIRSYHVIPGSQGINMPYSRAGYWLISAAWVSLVKTVRRAAFMPGRSAYLRSEVATLTRSGTRYLSLKYLSAIRSLSGAANWMTKPRAPR